jgi:hypothetical protein
MRYNRLKEFLLNKGYSNSDDCLCVFIRKSTTEFCIILVYVDDLNIISHIKDIDEARNHLKMEFEMKDLVRTKFCLGLQLEHLQTGILVHQSLMPKKYWKIQYGQGLFGQNSYGCSCLRKGNRSIQAERRRRRRVGTRIVIPKCHWCADASYK